jgi:hypothetical protein
MQIFYSFKVFLVDYSELVKESDVKVLNILKINTCVLLKIIIWCLSTPSTICELDTLITTRLEDEK